MAVDMLDSANISEQLRLLCQSKLKLTANCSASATVTVGSTELFRTTAPNYPITGLSVGAVLDDSDTCPEPVTITEITDLTTLVLHQACAGTFTTAKQATIRLGTVRVALGASAAVTEGPFKWADTVAAAKLPAITVEEQPVSEGPGTLQQFEYVYNFRVLYARQKATDEQSARVLKQQIKLLHDLLREDIYLGGTADNVEITAVDYRPPEGYAYEHESIDVGYVGVAVTKYHLWSKSS